MMKRFFALIVAFVAVASMAQHRDANYAKKPRFSALVCYSLKAEEAHVEFATQAVEFFKKLNYGEGFYLDFAIDANALNDSILSRYDVVVMINTAPTTPAARRYFEQYMEQGGGWVGFHAAAYNDRNTRWPWFNEFLGCGTFLCNNWPPQPALLKVDVANHDVTRNLPAEFVASSSEWYQWTPSPSKNPDVEVLLSLSPKNYPLGIKDVVYGGDFPVVWTNKRYRMIYLNMGHGADGFNDPTTCLLYVNAFRWVVSRSPFGNPFDK